MILNLRNLILLSETILDILDLNGYSKAKTVRFLKIARPTSCVYQKPSLNEV